MESIEFRLLGPLEVVADGRPAALGTGRRRSLLCVLLLHANEVVPRDVLIDALWDERPPATAPNALQVQVHALRKLLGEARIVTDGPGYRLHVEPGELDVERFERLARQGRAALGSGDAESAATTLRRALDLWKGQALADVAYESFARGEIARLEELRLVVLEERLEADLALGRHQELVPELEALGSEHPLRERIHGQLMLALYRSGRQSEALAAYRRLRSRLDENLGLEPGPELKERHRAILRHDETLRVEAPELRARRHLPAPQTGLVGRRRELEELGVLVRGGARLVTLTGPGGTGKTRLALQAAHALADAFPDGVHFVDVAQLREPSLAASTIVHALRLEERNDEPPAATLKTHLRDRRLLLLVDNFEVVEEAAPLLSDLLESAPGLALLVTSRTPLRLSAEHEYRVSPLSLGEAVELFAVRARAVAPAFRRPSEEAGEVAELCRRLDRLPLAIELAAARTRELAPTELLALLPNRLELASGGARDLPARQRALRATIDWSHDMLALDERVLFARLGVFVGGWTVAAAEAVCETSRSALASLVARSLVLERTGRGGELRFALLETVRDYALERLESSGEADAMRIRHAEHYATLAESAEQDPAGWLELLEEEHDNLRAAIAWAHEAGSKDVELRLVSALQRFWVVRGHLPEGRERIRAALQGSESGAPALRAKALTAASRLAHSLGDYGEMESHAEASLAAYRALGDRRGAAWALERLGGAVSHQGNRARGRSLLEEAAASFRELGDRRGLAVVLNKIGALVLDDGDVDLAISLCEESVLVFQELGARDAVVPPLVNLAIAAHLQQRHADALALFRQSIEIAHELGYTEALIYSFVGLAALLAATGGPNQAAVLLGAAESSAAATGVTLEPLERRIRTETLDVLRADLGEEALEAEYRAGAGLNVDDAVSCVFDRPGSGVAV